MFVRRTDHGVNFEQHVEPLAQVPHRFELFDVFGATVQTGITAPDLIEGAGVEAVAGDSEHVEVAAVAVGEGDVSCWLGEDEGEGTRVRAVGR